MGQARILEKLKYEYGIRLEQYVATCIVPFHISISVLYIYIYDALYVRYATGNDDTHHLLALLVPIGIHRVIEVVTMCRFKLVLGGRQLG